MVVVRIAVVTALVMIVVSSLSWSSMREDDAVGAPTTTTPAAPAGAPTMVVTAIPTASSTPATRSAAGGTPASLPFELPVEHAPSAAIAAPAAGRLVVPRIGVDAPIVTLALREDGTMPAPSGPLEVAAYAFAARPGTVGNVVIAGHVDFANYGAAVFYRLPELRAGDHFFVTTVDGSRFEYEVAWVAAYEESTAPVAEILGPTASETATLITCTGTFSAAAHAYDQRLVVRADRVLPAGG